ncbi:hypothetical protein BGW80DRAFT_1353208 [Lactifluus volemus]|nr:hypothetical protein BGW80DRAFT_1367385 [Lactifluus volemus]KAH9963056.1 hypothetical protein BGW80DRAFT_1353208 [Lactifluus volemus]
MKQLYFTRVLNRDPSRLNIFMIRIEDPQHRKHMVFLGGCHFGGHHEGTRRVLGIKEEWYEEGMRSFDILGRGES